MLLKSRRDFLDIKVEDRAFVLSYAPYVQRVKISSHSHTLRINYFIPRASALFSRMIAQGKNIATLTIQLKKDFHRYPTVFSRIR